MYQFLQLCIGSTWYQSGIKALLAHEENYDKVW